MIEESLEVMVWALEHGDPLNWRRLGDRRTQVRMQQLIEENGGPFKLHLYRFKYASRYAQAEHSERDQRQRR